VDSHAYFLRVQGADDQTVQALANGDTSAADITAPETVLLAYVKQLTESAPKTTPTDVQKLRDAGWNEDQIAEAVYITAMFAFFNRVADAFGIEPMGYLEANQLRK
jgi:alkylhydroperoxidase family enzyme